MSKMANKAMAEHEDADRVHGRKGKRKGPYASGEKSGGKIIEEYFYRDQDGQFYLRVERTEDKQFPQAHWDGKAWQWGAPKGPKLPYYLPQLMKATPEVPVFICEGEKDADNLTDLKLLATCASGGAGKWTGDLNKWFAGRQTAYVLQDNDDPGRKHAQKVAQNLTGIVSEIRIVALPGLAVKGDVSDWLAAGGTKEQFVELCAAAPLYEAGSSDADVAKLNESYALVIVGDKTVIMQPGKEIKFLALSAFNAWHANRFVTWIDDEDEEIKIPLAKYWMTHKDRRQYEGLVFAPLRDVAGHFNLWRGFAVEPKPGDCLKFLAHVKDNVCRGDVELFNWVIGWFAQIVQCPDKKIGTALVLRGKQGVGKTIVGQVFGSLLGDHYLLVADPRYITGRFNSHLASLLLLHADEGFWAGDHAAEGKLKDLITGDHHFIEYKGKEAFRVRNYLRLLVTGNPDWLVPAGFEERRFAVLDVGEGHMQDIPYFAAIVKEMNSGGRGALLDHLAKFDLATVDLRTIPKTAALLDQKLSSLTPEKGWWLDVLTRGELPWGCNEPRSCPAHRLFEHYIKHANKQGVRRRAIETQIGIFLNRHVPGLIKKEGSYAGVGVIINPNVVVPGSKAKVDDFLGTIYTFPPLANCRAAFAKMMQQDFAWNGLKDWREDSGT
jgi:hypothetical protein